MTRPFRGVAVLAALLALAPSSLQAQRYKPAGDLPGDRMINAYLAGKADALEANFPADVKSAEDWQAGRKAALREYMDMLGLDPLPARTPLKATVTGTLDRGDYVVEKLHYQSMPGLYVTANLYRPAKIEPGSKLPGVLYVCGHSGMGRDGNKAAYQSHGIWLGRHGYVCLVVDTLQLGEINAIHHGTYREQRWWWHSRGYTSAGVECWNGIRGIDYLETRPEVDASRIAVTGISGGGAATFWVAAADDRVKVAVPVSGMADLHSYVNNGVINGHCDCMFLYNTYQWPWTKIAGLIAPRPMLFVNSDDDAIFPMDANERVIARLERLYSKFGMADRVDAVVSVGGHAYRKDIRQASFRFLNTYLKDDPRPIEDSEVDIASELGRQRVYPIAPESLRAFPSEFPADEKNTTIDRSFVPMARVDLPAAGAFDGWKGHLIEQLRARTFRDLPTRVPPARLAETPTGRDVLIDTEDGIQVNLRRVAGPDPGQAAERVLLIVSLDDTPAEPGADGEKTAVYLIQPRGVGPTRWTRKNPPNYVERAHALIGRTVDGGRVWDVAAVARAVAERHGAGAGLTVRGRGAAGVLAAYAALVEPSIAGLIAERPPASHMDDDSPALLNVLRVLDVPEALGMLAPRTLTLKDAPEPLSARVAAIYEKAGAADKLVRGGR